MGSSIVIRAVCVVLLAILVSAKPRPAAYTPTGVQPPGSPPYNECRDRCVPGGIISGTGCVSFQDFPFNGDWSIFGASTWSCICVRARLGGFSAVSARGCAFNSCNYMVLDMIREFDQNCTDAAERYNGTMSTSITTKDPPHTITTEPTTRPTGDSVSTTFLSTSSSYYTNATTSGVLRNPPVIDPTIRKTTFVVYTTRTSTITLCPEAATSCSIGLVVTEKIALYTTTCPFSSVQESVNPHSPISNTTYTVSRWKPTHFSTTDVAISISMSHLTITSSTEATTSPMPTGPLVTSSTPVVFTGQGIRAQKKNFLSMFIAVLAVLFGF